MNTEHKFLAVYLGSMSGERMKAWHAMPEAERKAKEREGMAAWHGWVEKHKDVVPKLYAAYKDAGEWTVAHPDEASKLIAPRGSSEDQKAIADLIRANDRLGMNIRSAAEVSKEIKSVYAAGKSISFLPSEPSAATIYQGPMQ